MEQDTLVFDNIDLDLFIKVFAGTVFSPFFTFFVPLVYRAQGAAWTDAIVMQASAWFIFTLLFWFIRFSSKIYRNGGSLLIGPPRLDWGEQIVLITGGASGVGALLANTLAVRNVVVVVLDVSKLVTENYNITSYICDVSDWKEVEAIQKRIVEDIGHPTVIINNAAVVQGKGILELSEHEVRQTFSTNLFGAFWVLKAFLPELIRLNSGHVITMSSVLGEIGVSKLTDYCASKAALMSLNESLRYELDKKYQAPNVRTTLVVPGHIMSPLFGSITPPKTRLLRFCAPALSTHTVVKAVIAAIDNQFSITIRLPFYVHMVPLIKLMPSFIRDFFQWFSGADYAIKDTEVDKKREKHL